MRNINGSLIVPKNLKKGPLFLRSQSHDVDAILHTGAPLGVEELC